MTVAMTFGWASATITLLAELFYILSILKGRSQPSRMTWIILATLSCIMAWSYSEVGATDTFWAAFSAAIGSVAVAFLSLKYGHGGWETVDKFTFAGVLLVAALWYWTGSPFIALIASLTVDCLALVPTISKLIKYPSTEEFGPWMMTVAGNALNVLALDVTQMSTWSVDVAVYPFYMLALNGLVVMLIIRPILLQRRRTER